MDDPLLSGLGGAFIKQTKEIADSLCELEARTDELLVDAEKVDEDLANCRKFREEQLLKYLSETNSDVEQMQMLRDNIELKETADEFYQGIELIMEKYREHSEGDMFIDSYQLKERYLAGLEKVVQEQAARIENMLELMKLTADLEDRCSDENQQVIRQLTGENEQMRRQLQISSSDEAFRQGNLGSSESSTQFDPSDPDASAENSIYSVESFLSCLSPSNMADNDNDGSSSSSQVSQLEVSRFIEEALAENSEDSPSSQTE
ncbi:FGFR1 oncogene partner 2 homolog [Drosophila biarmipes]|uniref:FGFR1 oncogene partner 2 homolog n=1 Tax=Drosophila biarmipes TaxID=125945 RepID=UPI0007E5F0EE|nr:FGFR1 oncogene partner 2 homolog [Drosophila biarmipes]